MNAEAHPEILAVLVLYGRAPEESPAFRALRAFQCHSGGSSKIDLLVVDNSPFSHPPPADFDGSYLSYPSNPGLAQPYNEALQRAEQRKIPWLMLLDQDTMISEEYLEEVLQLGTSTTSFEVVALVPKLMWKGHLLSPHVLPYWPAERPLATDVEGVTTRRLHYFNSGAVIVVSALRKIGGFPQEFWLDYLDHAVFFQLQRLGWAIRILRSSLQHQLSTVEPDREEDSAWVQRQNNTLFASVRYFQRYERGHRLLQHRFRLLSAALGCIARRQFAKGRRLLAAALYRAEGNRND